MIRALVPAGIALLLLSSSAYAFKDFEDDGSQWNYMHVCQHGAVFFPMIGVDVHNNRFLCGNTPLGEGAPNGNASQAPFFYKGETHSVLVCDDGEAMVGLEVGNNTLACAPAKLAGQRKPDTGHEVVEPNHDRSTMHACPSGKVMVGIQAHDNVLICQ
jgi:hypothetical protein